jgi:two-component system, chemotaxis family, CheB/CheR fusion protein
VILDDQHVRWLVNVGRLFRDQQGKAAQLIGVTYDMTERKQMEDALRSSEFNLRMILENSRDGIHQLDLTTNRYVFMSPSLEELTGFKREELMFSLEETAARLHPEDRAHVDAYLMQVIVGEDPARPMEYRWRVRSGEYRWFSDSRRAICNEEGKAISLIGVSHDITERKQAEVQLQALTESLEHRVQERTQQVRDLASQIAQAEHKERKRIARVLHDHVQQMLYGLQIRAHMLQQTMLEAAPESAESHLSAMQQLTEDAIHAVRTLTVELSPPVLEQEGLIEALHWLADHMHYVHGLSIQVEAEGSCGVADKNLSVQLFQILRELLFNVVKHADVGHASVKLYRQGNECIAVVSDQGKGFDLESHPAEESANYGFGLTHIAQRLSLFGGLLHIQSSPGAGTQVTVALPLFQAEAQKAAI